MDLNFEQLEFKGAGILVLGCVPFRITANEPITILNPMFHTVIVAVGTLDQLLSVRAINWPALCQLMKMLAGKKVQALNVLWSFYSQTKRQSIFIII